MTFPNLPPNLHPSRLVTLSMPDKFTALCFIYEGKQYQNLCHANGQNGTCDPTDQCLNKLTANLPYIGYLPNSSETDPNSRGLVKFNQNNADDFPDILSAISYYWFEVLLLCLVSALIFHIIYVTLRNQTSLYRNLFHQLTGKRFFKPERHLRGLSAGPKVDERGAISIGKISFDPKAVLGLGSKGTCVFKGNFEGSSSCAVKRIVSQYLTLADREVDFLRSLQHPNLVRYLATEEDAQFVYIALELAEFTLAELVETKRTNQIGLTMEELCHQAALGLEHLHKLDIVHRDIKPQNILISFPTKPSDERKVMISDFGLSKQLSNLDTGHTSSAMRYFDGTQGWMAPEIINAKLSEDRTLLPTKSADIFSLGCVFYYVLSNGKHPFGENDQRQSNIIKDNSSFTLFTVMDEKVLQVDEDKATMANILIKSMIQSEASARPPIGSILSYPFFWTKAQQLQFLLDVSDRIDKLDQEDELVRLVELNRQKIFAFGWKNSLTDELKENLSNFRTYNGRLVCHLLRAIRNKKHHYRELPKELKVSLGDLPDGYMNYFSSRFPELLPHIYQAMQKCKSEPEFKVYYEQSEYFEFK